MRIVEGRAAWAPVPEQDDIMPKNSSAARRDQARALAAAENISYTAALRRLDAGQSDQSVTAEEPGTVVRKSKAAIRARMAATGEPYAEAARQLRHQAGGDPYGYDPATDTLRVGRHDLARLLLQFREELEHGPGRPWSHMSDYDISFERLADAVDYAGAHLPPDLRTASAGGPDDRMRCKRTPGYRWPGYRPVEALTVRAAPSRGASHYAWWDHDFGETLCGLTFTREDGVTAAAGEPACPECVREQRLSAGQAGG